MNGKVKWTRVLYIIGVTALIIGSIDPLEGSVLIAAGCACITFTTYRTKDRHWKIFLTSLIMIVTGVFFLFYFSSLGGFGGSSTLSWWWSTLILPYPLGWLLSIVMLIVRVARASKQPAGT